MSKKNFAKINQSRAASGLKLFKNARNLVSGMLHIDVSEEDLANSGDGGRKGRENHTETDSAEDEDPLVEAKTLGNSVNGSIDFMAYSLVVPKGSH